MNGEQKTAIPVRADDALQSPATTTHEITSLVRLAIEEKVPVETLERLNALLERVMQREAVADFNRALADFRRVCPKITKNAVADIVTDKGSRFSYRYAELSHIAEIVGPLLYERGFSYTWDTALVAGQMTVTCILEHVNGHKKTSTFTAPTESRAGMSPAQKHGAAVKYGERLSLCQVLGITTADPDTDGAEFEPISAEQADELKRMAKEVNADEARFLAYMGVSRFEDIPRGSLKMAINALESKRRRPSR